MAAIYLFHDILLLVTSDATILEGPAGLHPRAFC